MRNAERDDLETIAYEEERNEQILNEKMEVERIVAHSRDPETNTFDYLIKWCRLDYRFCTWESGRVVRALYLPAVESYEARCRSTTNPDRTCEVLRMRPPFVPLSEQPSYLGDSEDLRLRDYQLEGINWIVRAWCRENSVILADEMGLGKTIQTIGFLSYLFHEHNLYGPFLIVVPLSTISSWQKELQLWAPDMNAIIYTGDHISRQLIREHEWCGGGAGNAKRQQMLKFNICVTTYEILLKDKSWLSQVSWSFLGVDEAHRLKNDCSQLYKTLQTFSTNTRLLVTGTPLQNTMKELWALLHFIMPERFPDWTDFEQTYSVLADDSAVRVDGEAFHNLHKVLRPFLLRRVKKDVESSLPAKIEQILRVDMSKEQANIYRLILARNYDGLLKVTRGHKASFINIVMELKKCCNHAHLIAPPSELEYQRLANEEHLRAIIRGSGKMNLLDKLLQRLKPKGHRVLIFSQMVRMLDLIADYLSLRGWGFQRLDGSIRGALRKQALDHFNAEGSTDFCFLLSTRAGGLGINLATADTVIIFDSDWNPQNDLQAQARAHRIGQTKQVSVYRLVTRDSVEEKIIESATRKMVLDHLVIQRMDSGGRGGGRRGDTAKGQLLTEILRYGAEGLFKQNDDDLAEPEVDIDDILNTAETRDTDAAEEANPANALLSSFKVVTLDAHEDDPEASQGLDSSNEKTWDQIIPSELRSQLKAEDTQRSLVELELGPRQRKQVKTYQAGLDVEASSGESSAETDYKSATQLSEKEIRALVRAIKRFARPLERIDAIAADAELPDRTEEELRDVIEAVLKGCQTAMEVAADRARDDSSKPIGGRGPVFQYGRVSVAARPLLQSLEYLETLHQCLPGGGKDARMAFELPFTPKLVAWSCPWDAADDVRLLAGVYEHGYDNWEAIKLDSDLGLGSKLLPVSITERPQANHIRSRVDYLLRMLAKHQQRMTGENSPGSCSNHSLGKKRTRGEIVNQSSDKRTRSASSSQKRHRNGLKTSSHSSSTNIAQPKSAEFVETDDSSSDSDDLEPESSTCNLVKKPKVEAKVKNSKTEVKSKTKHSVKLEPKQNSDSLVKAESPIAITLEDESEFRKMRGPLFLKCKEKLLPIKKHFKQLERLEDSSEEDTKYFAKVMLRIGDHIHSLVRDMKNEEDRHRWKEYFWEFVQIFSKKSTEELRHIYRHAAKRRHKSHAQAAEMDEHRDTEQEDAAPGISFTPHNPETSVDTPDASSKRQRYSSWSKKNDRHKHLDRNRYSYPLDDPDTDSPLSHHGSDISFKRDRNSARFDNAFNRPPSSYGYSQGYSSYRPYPNNHRLPPSSRPPYERQFNSTYHPFSHATGAEKSDTNFASPQTPECKTPVTSYPSVPSTQTPPVPKETMGSLDLPPQLDQNSSSRDPRLFTFRR
ncbi:unnamed protein product [Calicophoron daubneyi]